MSLEPITLNLPSDVLTVMKERAQLSHRSVEEELVDSVLRDISRQERLPDDLEEFLASMVLFTDDELWRAAKTFLSTEAADQFAALNTKQQYTGLTPEERETVMGIAEQYERLMVIRAQAAVLLKQRGHDIASLGPDR